MIKEKVQKAKAWAKEHKALIGGAIGAAVTAVVGGFAVKTLCNGHTDSNNDMLDMFTEPDGDMPDDYREEQCQIGYNGRDVPAMLQVLSNEEAAFWVDPKELTNSEED